MTALNEMSREELLAFIATMKAQPARKITAKVSEKGAMSVYGLGRFPVTLYRSQWERLLDDATVTDLKAFMAANRALLADKA